MAINTQSTQDEKNAHYRGVLQAYVASIGREDVDSICSLFSDEAEVEDPLGGPRGVLKGPEAIRLFYELATARHVRMEVVGHICGSRGDAAAMMLRIRLLGQELDCVSVARFTEEGLIRRYTAHHGPGDYYGDADPSKAHLQDPALAALEAKLLAVMARQG